LCQAKIAAAELWRAYSEHYRSHQARHPVTNFSRHQQQQQRETVDDVRQSVSVGTVAAEAALSQKTLQVE